MASESAAVAGAGSGESPAHQPGDNRQRPEFVAAFFHGTKADLKHGDSITPGNPSNYGRRKSANFVYLSANLGPAIWGAELAVGDGPERIYVVEPAGPLDDDPNVTDKKFPGNPTRSYRTRQPVRIVGQVTNWQGHSADELKAMKDAVALAAEQGIEHIDD